MPHLNNPRAAATRHQPPVEAALDPDAFLIDDEFDDYLDRHVLAIRESLADFRNV